MIFKGGGGGKGTWGKGGLDDLYIPKMSPKDPAFDDQEENKKVTVTCIKQQIVLEETSYNVPNTHIESIIRDYFVSGEVEEACMSVEEKLDQKEHPSFVRKCMVYVTLIVKFLTYFSGNGTTWL